MKIEYQCSNCGKAVLEYQNFRFRETREASQLPPTKVGGLQKRASVTSKP